MLFVMAGGGTGGHVMPSLAVAEVLRAAGHDALFIGTRRGMEATIVPRAGFGIEWIEIGGLQRLGLAKQLKSLYQLPASVLRSLNILRRKKAAAVFSMGGYVAAPVMLAAVLNRTPMVVMEPNAMPGLVSRKLAKFVDRAMLSFEEARAFFPAGKAELSGLPVREAFWKIQPRKPASPFRVLITGGSRGSKALNKAAEDSWPLFRDSGIAVSILLQCGADEHQRLARRFNETGIEGEVVPFLHDMPAAYASADLIVSRAGAGAVSEICASGRASVLVPFPFAADDHQKHNAEAMRKAGASLMFEEQGWSGQRLFECVNELAADPARLESLARHAKTLALPGAAERAAEILLQIAKHR